jgi:hypothetical protein
MQADASLGSDLTTFAMYGSMLCIRCIVNMPRATTSAGRIFGVQATHVSQHDDDDDDDDDDSNSRLVSCLQCVPDTPIAIGKQASRSSNWCMHVSSISIAKPWRHLLPV